MFFLWLPLFTHSCFVAFMRSDSIFVVWLLYVFKLSENILNWLACSLWCMQVPSYISRSVAGSYDNEAVAIFALVFTFYLYVKVGSTFSNLALHAFHNSLWCSLSGIVRSKYFSVFIFHFLSQEMLTFSCYSLTFHFLTSVLVCRHWTPDPFCMLHWTPSSTFTWYVKVLFLKSHASLVYEVQNLRIRSLPY